MSFFIKTQRSIKAICSDLFSKEENDAANKELAEIKKFEKTIEDTEEELEPAMELN